VSSLEALQSENRAGSSYGSVIDPILTKHAACSGAHRAASKRGLASCAVEMPVQKHLDVLLLTNRVSAI
jgi:K+-transporting ATPase c subunit